MSKKSLITVLLLIAAVGAGVFIWRVQDARAREAEILKEITVEDLNLIFKSENSIEDSGTVGIAQTPESRRLFLKGMREYLALAAEARREGMTEDSQFKVNFEYKKNLLLADLYKTKLTKEQGNYYTVPKEELEAVWKNPNNEKQFNTDIETLQAIQAAVGRERGENFTPVKLQGGSLAKARDNWARAKILSERAKADAEFMAQPEIGLRIKILEAGILSADYLRKHWAKSIRATDGEIADYLKANPQYDVNKKRETAERVLQRVRSGEDFGKLAAEFSEDRTTKNKGGLFENVEKDTIWIEVERAALTLEKGQIANRLIETHTGFHIIKLEDKKIEKQKGGAENIKFSVSHILLQKAFEEPGNTNAEIPPPFLTALEIAKAEIEKQKRDKFVEAIVGRNEITLPEDFTVKLPESGAKAEADKR